MIEVEVDVNEKNIRTTKENKKENIWDVLDRIALAVGLAVTLAVGLAVAKEVEKLSDKRSFLISKIYIEGGVCLLVVDLYRNI